MASIPQAIRQARPGFYGWRIAGLLLGPRAAGVGIYVVGNTLFVIPLEQDLGISRTVSSLLFALSALVTGIATPFSGVFMDRIGPRKVLLVSVVVGAAGYALFGMAHNIVVVFLVFLGPISMTMLNIAFNASSGIINNWFDRHKATAFSVLQAGAGLGSFIIIPLLTFAIGRWDWRAAAFIAAGAIALLGLPAGLLARDTPEEMGLLPDGDEPTSPTPDWTAGGEAFDGTVGQVPRGAEDAPFVMTGMSAQEAFRTRSFWMLTAAVMLIGGGTIGIQVHFVPIMVWKGLSEGQAGIMLTGVGLSGMVMVMAMGWAADRFDRLAVGALVCVTAGLGVLVMDLASGSLLWLAVFLFAANMGIWPIAWAVVGQMFGRRAYSTIRGYIMAAEIMATFAIPLLNGLLYVRTGSYTIALWLGVGMWAGGALLMAATPRRTYAGKG